MGCSKSTVFSTEGEEGFGMYWQLKTKDQVATFTVDKLYKEFAPKIIKDE